MDLVAGVRKEGSRGGRASFKWEDVKDDQHRENYLGHSLMAPVGRWQKNKDLGWYAKGDSSQAAQDAAAARAEEIRRIKEAEQDALSAALGFAPVERSMGNNVGGVGKGEVEKAIRETAEGEEEGGKGVGFGAFGGGKEGMGLVGEEMGDWMPGRGGEKGGLEGGRVKARGGERRRRGSGSPSRDGGRIRRHRRRHEDYDERERRHRRHRSRSRSRGERGDRRRERSRSRGEKNRRYERSRSYERRRQDGRPGRRERSRSPVGRRRANSRDDGRRR
ncbi:hypothetical protein MMC08_002424 [Hypocenomyce scalaris]|nr:hypothetical protein [Hypocenomyce scalaris]